MIKMAKTALALAIMISPMTANIAWADEAALTQRIDRLERIIQGQGLISLLGRVDQLQNEVQRLNGDNESLRHEIELMQRRQRELYLDIDQRLQAQTAVAPAPVVPEVEVPPVLDPEQPVMDEPVSTIEPVPAVEPTAEPETETPAPETSPVAVENGEAAYQSALQILRSGQYEQAVVALSAFPEQYPHSSYLPNAYYWQGEASYVLRNFDSATVAFQTVIDQYPASSKVADATLKLGFSQYELGQSDSAKTTLMKVMEQYPNTSASRLAKVRLDRIKQETP